MNSRVPWIPASRAKVTKKFRYHIPFQQKNYDNFLTELDRSLTFKSRAKLRKIKYLYDPIDPDSPYNFLSKSITFKESSIKSYEHKFLNDFSNYCKKASFHQLSKQELYDHVIAPKITQDGLKVYIDEKDFEVIKVWVSGIKEDNPPEHIKSVYEFFVQVYLTFEYLIYGPLFRLLHGKEFETRSNNVYNFVLIAIREKNGSTLNLKAFRDIPTNQLNRLIPNVSTKMNYYDMIGCFGTSMTALYQSIANAHPNFLLLLAVSYRFYYRYKYAINIYARKQIEFYYYKNLANNKTLISAVCDRRIDEQFKAITIAYMSVLILQKQAQHATFDEILEFSENLLLESKLTEKNKFILQQEERLKRIENFKNKNLYQKFRNFDELKAVSKLKIDQIVDPHDRRIDKFIFGQEYYVTYDMAGAIKMALKKLVVWDMLKIKSNEENCDMSVDDKLNFLDGDGDTATPDKFVFEAVPLDEAVKQLNLINLRALFLNLNFDIILLIFLRIITV